MLEQLVMYKNNGSFCTRYARAEYVFLIVYGRSGSATCTRVREIFLSFLWSLNHPLITKPKPLAFNQSLPMLQNFKESHVHRSQQVSGQLAGHFLMIQMSGRLYSFLLVAENRMANSKARIFFPVSYSKEKSKGNCLIFYPLRKVSIVPGYIPSMYQGYIVPYISGMYARIL